MKQVFAYLYDASFDQANFDKVDYLTSINYSFGKIKDGLLTIEKLNHFEEVKKFQNKNLKLLLSIGGWGADGFSDAVISNESRKSLNDSIMKVVIEKGLDGIDLDWEYPACDWAGIKAREEDTVNFTSWVRELREALDNYKKGLLLTIAVGASDFCINHLELIILKDYVDYFNIMTYDMNHKGNTYCHHTNLYRSKYNVNNSADYAIQKYHKAGLPLEKIIMGIAFYGKGGSIIKDNEVKLQSCSFSKIKNELLKDPKNKLIWDDEAKAPILLVGDDYITYDDEKSIYYKCQYTNLHRLGGVMFWQLTSDNTNTLLTTIHENLK